MLKPQTGFGRTCLYHRDTPGGRIFDNLAEFQQALRDGWVDAPWEVDNPGYVPRQLQELRLSESRLNDVPDESPMQPWQKAVEAKRRKRAAKEAAGGEQVNGH